MPFKNLLIILTSVIILVAGGYLILQNRPQSPQETNSPLKTVSKSPELTASASASPQDSSESNASPTPKPRTTITPPARSVSPEPSPEDPGETPEPSPSVTPTPSPVSSTLVSYTNSGYVPAYIEIEAGAIVTFENDSTSSMWTASDNHPTHTLYPDSGISKCETSPETIFDACGPIQPGESWSFKFEYKGTWKYHDHLYPSYGGIILVK